MSTRKQNFSYQHQNKSVSQGYSNEYIKEPSFSSNKDKNMKDYHENDKCKEKDLESEEFIVRKQNGHIFCNACNKGINGIMNKHSGIFEVSSLSLRQHLTGSVHKFSLQIYGNKSKAAMLVTEALNQKIIQNRGYRFYCHACGIILEYNTIALLTGHLLNVEHLECLKNASAKMDPKAIESLKNATAKLDPNPLQTSSSSSKETKIEAENGSYDQLTVMVCQLCNAEVCALNIDTHIASTRHISKVGNLKGENTNQASPKTKDMEPDEAIKLGIVELKDVTYFCNACEKQLPNDGTLNPLKTHLVTPIHKLRTVFSKDQVKKAVEEEIKSGNLTFKFKANEVKQEYSEKAVDLNNQQLNELQGDKGSIHIIKGKKIESNAYGSNTVEYRWILPSRVIHVCIFKNHDDKAITNERLIEMASPYGEVTCVKIMERKRKVKNAMQIMALLEMVDLVAAKNLINKFALDKKHFQNVILKYSEHKFIKNGHHVTPKMFTETANFKPLGHEKHFPVSQKNFSGAYNEPLGHAVQSDYLHTSQTNFPPKKISDRNLLQPDYFNIDREHTVSYDRTEHIPASQPWTNVHKEASKNIIDYGHKEASTTVIDYGHKTSYPSIVPNLTPPVPYQSNIPLSSPSPPYPLVVPSVPSPSEVYNDLYKATSSQDPILPSTALQDDFKMDITQSLGLSSGTAAELNNIMASMSAEQRKMWEQRLSENLKSMEQEIEEDEDFVKPSIVTTNSEYGESRKRKYHNEEQERTKLVDFASKKTSVYTENRYGCSSKDVETSYWSKKQKKMFEEKSDDVNPHDKSKYNLYARGFSIDHTKQDIYEFFSKYGDITNVFLEWCENPTFVGEQSAYIAFTNTDDVNALVNEHSVLYVKDSIISIKMYIDSSNLKGSVIHVSGITQINSNTKLELTNYFNEIGPVKSVMLNSTSRNAHYAFVVFDNEEVAKKVISPKEHITYRFNNDLLKFKKLKIMDDEKKIEESEITQKTISIPADNYDQLIKHSVNILKELMKETGATYEFILQECSSFNQTLRIHGTPEQIFSAIKLIKEKSGIQNNSKIIKQKTRNDPPKILIVTDHVNDILEAICTHFVDLEFDTCVKILENVSLTKLFNKISEILNEMSNVKYVIFVWGIQDLTENVDTSKGLFHVPKEDLSVMDEFLKQSQAVSNRLLIQFPHLKVLWTTPTPYNFEKYNRTLPTMLKKHNRKNVSHNEHDESQLLPIEYWKVIQSNFHKCLIHLRSKMLQSDPHCTVDFLKLFLDSDHSSNASTGEQMLLKGEVPKEEWFTREQTKLNTEGGRALRQCIRKTVQRQILWGSDSEGTLLWCHHVKAMLDKELQKREQSHRNLKLITVPGIEEVIRQENL